MGETRVAAAPPDWQGLVTHPAVLSAAARSHQQVQEGRTWTHDPAAADAQPPGVFRTGVADSPNHVSLWQPLTHVFFFNWFPKILHLKFQAKFKKAVYLIILGKKI